MNKQIVFGDLFEIEKYREWIINNSKMTTQVLRELLSQTEGLNTLKQMKFRKIGRDPFYGEDLNLIEQLNQTFTYLVCLEAVKYLIQENPGHRYLVNFGTQNGFDVSSLDSNVICECFSSTSPDSK